MSQQSSAPSDAEPSNGAAVRRVTPAVPAHIDAAGGENAEYIAELYEQYLRDADSVDASWQAFFAGFHLGGGDRDVATGPAPSAAASNGSDKDWSFSDHLAHHIAHHLGPAADRHDNVPSTTAGHLQRERAGNASEAGSIGIYDLVHTYREFGHFEAQLDPLAGVAKQPGNRDGHPMLAADNFGLDGQPDDLQVGSGGFLGPVDGTLGDLVAKLRETYCGNIGVEFTGIADRKQRRWLQEQMEPILNRPQLTSEQKKHVLRQLVAAEEFEQYLHRVFVGAKRFSAEGAEALVPLLNTIVETCGDVGGEQVMTAMAHRGRLNVLAHVLQKPYETMLAEFAGTVARDDDPAGGDGDVKYHLGYANQRRVQSDKGGEARDIKVSLLPNPSHLELINPIQQGIIRCKQQWLLDGNRAKVVPVCVHGDAAFCGQGVVFETLNLSELIGYRTGGTIHVIVNNQIGFTTPPRQGRFTPYPTDVAKSIQAPVFHVNGDDPEAVFHVSRLATEFRQKFKQDVFIDLWCYRKYGHNEADEPSFTQPQMYEVIKKHKSAREQYAQRLLDEGTVTKEELKSIKTEAVDRLKAAREAAMVEKPRGKSPSFSGVWNGMGRAPADYRRWQSSTSVDVDLLSRVVAPLQKLPKNFTIHPKLEKVMQARVDAAAGNGLLDFGTAEMFALGSLLLEGTSVRFTGQDVERGTFSHRHAVLHDYNTGERYRPLQHVGNGGGGEKHADQGRFEIINTMLSEEAVVGFEWGFASADPRNLVVWEAQFGDFVNGAQNVIDQIIVAAESKWGYMNGLVLNLPHGYEGQGPEHSNAYLERWLSLCAENNMQVAAPSTPAQYFHLLRRQVHRDFRKPLVVMTPKSLLRRPEAMSERSELIDGSLKLVIDDPSSPKKENVRRVLVCSGKVFYTLDEARKESDNAGEIAIVRVEQLYPFPKHELEEVVNGYAKASEIVWVQEESSNRGAWSFMQPRLRELFPDRLIDYCGRDASASPAVGSAKMHALEEAEFVAEAMKVPAARGSTAKA